MISGCGVQILLTAKYFSNFQNISIVIRDWYSDLGLNFCQIFYVYQMFLDKIISKLVYWYMWPVYVTCLM